MLTVEKALTLNLKASLLAELSKFPKDYIVALDQDNKLYAVPNIPENIRLLDQAGLHFPLPLNVRVTWGEGPDIVLVIRKTVLLLEDPTDYAKFTHGVCAHSHLDLTAAEALELAADLQKAAARVKELEDGYEKECREKEQERDNTMSTQKPKPGPLVEDVTVTGGTDKKTGAPVIKPKTPDGKCDESVNPTDKREKK